MATTKFLLGAPNYEACLDNEKLTMTEFQPAFRWLVKGLGKRQPPNYRELEALSSPNGIAWRSVSSRNKALPTGLSQQDFLLATPANAECKFNVPAGASAQSQADVRISPGMGLASTADESFLSEDLEMNERQSFYNESFALHEQDLQRQLTPLTQEEQTTDPHLRGENEQSIQNLLSGITLSKLRDIPLPSTVAALNPQTITMNVLVGVLAKEPIRTVTTRRTGREVDMVELAVGDETLPRFQITLWLGNAGDGKNRLSDEAEVVRPGDVVLIRNVALHVYKRSVYGQSLGQPRRRDRAKFSTTVSLVLKNYQRVGKNAPTMLKKVKGWIHDTVQAPKMTEMAPPSNTKTFKRQLDLQALPENDTPAPTQKRLRPREAARNV